MLLWWSSILRLEGHESHEANRIRENTMDWTDLPEMIHEASTQSGKTRYFQLFAPYKNIQQMSSWDENIVGISNKCLLFFAGFSMQPFRGFKALEGDTWQSFSAQKLETRSLRLFQESLGLGFWKKNRCSSFQFLVRLPCNLQMFRDKNQK